MASWTPPTILPADSVLSSPDYNAVANNTTFLYQAPYASWSPSSPPSIPTSGNTQVPLDTENYGGYGFSISTGDIICPLTGVYQVNFRIAYSGASVGGGFAQVFLNGSSTLWGSWVSFDGATALQSAGAGLLPISAGGALQLVGFQNSGITATTTINFAQTAIDVFFVGSQ